MDGKNRWIELTFCYDINGKVEKRDSGIDDIDIYGGLNELNENVHLFGIIIKDYREQR